MFTKVVGVRRRLTRRRLRRAVRLPKYTGQKGWNWTEIEISNSFTNVDNVIANGADIAQGGDFDVLNVPTKIGSADAKLAVYRSVRIQGQVSVQTTDPERYPYVAYDVGLVKFDDDTDVTVANFEAPRIRSICLATDNRLIWHQRVWAARQAALADSESTDSAYGTGVLSSLIDVQLKPNVPLGEKESLALVLSQVDSELYSDGDAALFTGYVKSWVQLK